jgi:hypothetical protein
MPGQVCKAAICIRDCLDAIVVGNFQELGEAVYGLVVNEQLTEDQLTAVIDLFTDFESEIKRRKREDRS